MMLLLPGKRPSFDILPYKKIHLQNKAKLAVDQVEIVPMGLPELQSIFIEKMPLLRW